MLFRKVHVFFWIIYLANTFLATTLKAQVNGNQDVTYISPAQGSYLNHPSTDILIRYSKPIQQNTLSFSVSASGKQIQVTYTLLNDEKTVLIHPLNILPTNVSINVSSKDGLLFSGGETIQKLQFSFYTTSKISHQLIDNENPVLGNKKNIETFYGISDNTLLNKISNQIHLNVTANNNKSNGYFLAGEDMVSFRRGKEILKGKKAFLLNGHICLNEQDGLDLYNEQNKDELMD